MENRTNIMIIDDSYTNRVLMRAILEDLDMHIIEMSSGIKALKVLDETNPDIILLDICMPMMNGFDFLKELKSRKKNVPVIVVSVLDEQIYIKQAYQWGANEYLFKPLDTNKLISAIAKYTEHELSIN